MLRLWGIAVLSMSLLGCADMDDPPMETDGDGAATAPADDGASTTSDGSGTGETGTRP
jgi:hypothetical protein